MALGVPLQPRQDSMSARFGEDLSEAVKVVTAGYLAAPFFLETLEKTWIDYNSSQEEIRLCKDGVRKIACAFSSPLPQNFFLKKIILIP